MKLIARLLFLLGSCKIIKKFVLGIMCNYLALPGNDLSGHLPALASGSIQGSLQSTGLYVNLEIDKDEYSLNPSDFKHRHAQ